MLFALPSPFLAIAMMSSAYESLPYARSEILKRTSRQTTATVTRRDYMSEL